MKTIHFQVKDANTSPKTSGFSGYYVVASFVLRTVDGLLSSALKADLDDLGKGIFYFPPNYQIEHGLIHFEFYGSGGYWVTEKLTLSETKFNVANTSDKPILFEVPIMREKVLDNSVQTVNGRLVDINAKQKVSKKQFYVLESATEELTGTNYKIVQAVLTDFEGYYRFDMQLAADQDEQKYYFAAIPCSMEKILPFRMNGKLIEDRQILALTIEPEKLKEGEVADADCACDDTPRLPSSGDLASMEGAFSQDLGVGCVEFTKANRVVEEYQFMHIVRTTDPQIQKVNLKSNTFKEILGQLEAETNPFVYVPINTLVFSDFEVLEMIGVPG